MKKVIAIIAGEPNSINSEIIAKIWRKKITGKDIFKIFIFKESKGYIN